VRTERVEGGRSDFTIRKSTRNRGIVSVEGANLSGALLGPLSLIRENMQTGATCPGGGGQSGEGL